jgi:serine/threonine-protein kinase RsbW
LRRHNVIDSRPAVGVRWNRPRWTGKLMKADTADTSVIEVVYESDLKNVEAAEEIVQRVCTSLGFDEEEQHKIGMAVHESMINAIWHGNKNDPEKRVWLQFRIFDDRFEIRIRDQGAGFDISGIPHPLEPENLLRVSGRGIFLIRSFMDDFQVSRLPEGGTEVTMVKLRQPQTGPNQGGLHREHEGHNTPS